MEIPAAARAIVNRRNAQKSTGPRTNEGKARVAQNAWKHGLRSERNPLLLATDASVPLEAADYLDTLADFQAEFSPQSPLEQRLVERLAHLQLRLNRALRIETARLEASGNGLTRQNTQKNSNSAESNLSQAALDRSAENHALKDAFTGASYMLNLIGRYETRLSRDFAHTLRQLREAQAENTMAKVAAFVHSARQTNTHPQTGPLPKEENDRTKPTAHGPGGNLHREPMPDSNAARAASVYHGLDFANLKSHV